MAKTAERRVKDAVEKILKEHGVYYFFPMTGGYGKSGVPDIICCYKGKFLAIECKAEGKSPTALQLRQLHEIQKSEGITMVAAGPKAVETVRGWLKLLAAASE